MIDTITGLAIVFFVEWVCPRNQARGIMGRRTLKTSLLLIALIQGMTIALPVLEGLMVLVCKSAIFILLKNRSLFLIMVANVKNKIWFMQHLLYKISNILSIAVGRFNYVRAFLPFFRISLKMKIKRRGELILNVY